MDEIVVTALYRIKARMGEAIHRENIKYGNIIRQYFIQPEKQVEIPFLFYIDMKKELRRMYLRIRSPAANNCYR